MQDQYSRTQLLLGAEAMEKLHHARVSVFNWLTVKTKLVLLIC